MTYSLRRTRDGAGDSGPMSSAVFYNENGQPERTENARPFVGAVMIVGTYMARSFSAQDYWQTTPVTEIIKEWTDWVEDQSVECVQFKTGNSEYIWEKF
jgi:accessory colonization factor AcfC